MVEVIRRRVHLVAAARPNFMKIAPLYHELGKTSWCQCILVHTGQHYDDNMSGSFFRELGLPKPDKNLGVGSGTHAEQTAGVMTAYEGYCLQEKPDAVVVPGDVNSTLAAALVASKLQIPIAHLEAGLRSFDETMPEEINRRVVDVLADLLWTPSPDADENLRREGIPAEKIVRVGNIMIDSLERLRPQIEDASNPLSATIREQDYALVTLHRPANVDSRQSLQALVTALRTAAKSLHLVMVVHPRTAQRLVEHDLQDSLENDSAVTLLAPQPYLSFMAMLFAARLVITDSGGLQEETSYLGIPCLTVRPNTERPVTLSEGTNRLVEPESLATACAAAMSQPRRINTQIPGWDGRTAARAAASLKRFLDG